MKQKNKSRSLFQFLVEQPWWVSMIGGLLFTMGFGVLLEPEKRMLGIAAGLPFLIVSVIAAWRQWRAPSATKIAATQEKALGMNWPEFSAYLTRALQSKGFEVKPFAGKGADLEIMKPGKHMLISCKRWKAAHVGVEALRELQGAAETAGLHAMLMTMGKISPAAFEYAAQERIDLMDADGVALLLASTKQA